MITPFIGEKTDTNHPRGWVERTGLGGANYMPCGKTQAQAAARGAGAALCTRVARAPARKGRLTLRLMSDPNSRVHARLCLRLCPITSRDQSLCGASKGW